MKVYIASDHGGFELKKKIILFLQKRGYILEDFGPFQYNPKDDYPDYVVPLARKVAKLRNAFGIVLCRNGQGVCIATNKVNGIRAVTGFSIKEARMTRSDDNANVLSIPADYLTLQKSKEIIIAWLETPFSKKKRHIRRLNKVRRLEK
jgi:ribose 5-phosphate isomerase B